MGTNQVKFSRKDKTEEKRNRTQHFDFAGSKWKPYNLGLIILE